MDVPSFLFAALPIPNQSEPNPGTPCSLHFTLIGKSSTRVRNGPSGRRAKRRGNLCCRQMQKPNGATTLPSPLTRSPPRNVLSLLRFGFHLRACRTSPSRSKGAHLLTTATTTTLGLSTRMTAATTLWPRTWIRGTWNLLRRLRNLSLYDLTSAFMTIYASKESGNATFTLGHTFL